MPWVIYPKDLLQIFQKSHVLLVLMKKSWYILILKFASLSCLYEEFYSNWVAIASCRGLLFWRLNHQKRLWVMHKFQQFQLESLNERVRSTQKSCHKMSQLRKIRSKNQKPSAVVLPFPCGLSCSTIRTAACPAHKGNNETPRSHRKIVGCRASTTSISWPSLSKEPRQGSCLINQLFGGWACF